MATIAIRELKPAGTDLLIDQETYLNELTDDELDLTKGGATPTVAVVSSILAVGATAAATYAITKAGVKIFQAIF